MCPSPGHVCFQDPSIQIPESSCPPGDGGRTSAAPLALKGAGSGAHSPGCGETRAGRLCELQADCVLSAGREPLSPLSLPGSLPPPRQLQERGLLCTQPAHGPEVLQSKVALKNPSAQPPRVPHQPVPSVPPLPAQVGLGPGLQKVDRFKGSPPQATVEPIGDGSQVETWPKDVGSLQS